jgi:hypothetical protein
VARGGDSPEAYWKHDLEAVSSPLEAGKGKRGTGKLTVMSLKAAEARGRLASAAGTSGVRSSSEEGFRGTGTSTATSRGGGRACVASWCSWRSA